MNVIVDDDSIRLIDRRQQSSLIMLTSKQSSKKTNKHSTDNGLDNGPRQSTAMANEVHDEEEYNTIPLMAQTSWQLRPQPRKSMRSQRLPNF
ncbi:hypothetical protein ACLKA6_012228 [Drosophila palustris]